jgi:hypothetical protein
MKSIIIFFKCLFGKHELEWFDDKLVFKVCKHCHIVVDEWDLEEE